MIDFVAIMERLMTMVMQFGMLSVIIYLSKMAYDLDHRQKKEVKNNDK